MRVLRDNKESLMAVFETFVFDPLISWRLLNPSPRQVRFRSQVSTDERERVGGRPECQQAGSAQPASGRGHQPRFQQTLWARLQPGQLSGRPGTGAAANTARHLSREPVPMFRGMVCFLVTEREREPAVTFQPHRTCI
ncbi:MAG: hypothetical protein BJ554DRAFT_3758, partial [Olpidium bornovanus]